MKKLLHLTGIFTGIMLLFIYLSSCVGTSTLVTGTWESERVGKSYENIMVVALVPTVSSRSTIEKQMVESLSGKGVNATQSMDILPTKFIEEENRKQEILNNIRSDGADGILTVSLIDKETESRYVPGSNPYAPYPHYSFYGQFWGYYNYWYPRFYDRGYYTEDKVYYIETNLYDTETEELVWSAQSKTYDPVNLDTFSKDFAKAIVNKLDEADII